MLSRRELLFATATGVAGFSIYSRKTHTQSGIVLESTNPRTTAHRPIIGGSAISTQESTGYGTLGVGCSFDQSPAVITNRHVVDRDSDESSEDIIGRSVYQPTDSNRRIGEVVEASKLGGANSSDYAIIKLDTTNYLSNRTFAIKDIQTPKTPQKDQRILVDGFTTGMVGGQITRTSVDSNYRGILYNNLIEYKIDDNISMSGASGGIVFILDPETGPSPIGLHTFSIDEYKYAINWSDLPEDISLNPSEANSPETPETGARIESTLAHFENQAIIRVINIGGETGETTVSIRDSETTTKLDSKSLEIQPYSINDVTLDPNNADSIDFAQDGYYFNTYTNST